MFPWGRPELRTGAGGAIFRGSSPAAPPPQLSERSPPPGPAPGRDAGCTGMRGYARGCARMRGAAGAAQGPSGVASPSRRSRELERRCLPPWEYQPPFPSQDLPTARAGPLQEPGVGSLSTPRSHRLLRCAASFAAAASAPPPPGLPPEWEGTAVPPPRPFPSRPGSHRTPGRWAFRARTDCPADRRTHAPALEAGIPLVGGGRGRAPGRGGGGGGEGGRGGDRPGPEAPLALTRESPGRPKSSARPIWDPGRSPDPMQEARLGVRCLWVACLNRSRLHIPAAQSQGLEPNRCSINA